MHLFVATVEALMQPRIKAHVAKLDELIGAEAGGAGETGRRDRPLRCAGDRRVLQSIGDQDVTLSSLADRIESKDRGGAADRPGLAQAHDRR
jgi:hypothetical protein